MSAPTLRRVACVVALAGPVWACAESNSATVVEIPPPPQSNLPVAVAQPAAAGSARTEQARNVEGSWRGSYECAQGTTNLSLHVTRTDQDVRAVFTFWQDGGVRGAYSMSGFADAASGEVTLGPSRWIDRPAGYVMVGMRGTVRGNVFSGKIENPSCTGFDLRRTR